MTKNSRVSFQFWKGAATLLFTYHSSGRVDDLHLLEDGCSIVRNQDLTLGGLDLHTVEQRTEVSIDQHLYSCQAPFVLGARLRGTFQTYHFIHASGSERGAHDISHGYAKVNISG